MKGGGEICVRRHRFSQLSVASKSFHSSNMQRYAPSSTYFEQQLVNNLAMELVGGDDQVENTEVNHELHAVVLTVPGFPLIFLQARI